MKRLALIGVLAAGCSSGPSWDEEALQAYDQAERLYIAEHYAEAAEKYEFTLRYRDRIIDAYHHLAECYVRTGDPERAIAVLERARRVDPVNDTTLSRLARLLVAQGHTHEAIQVYAKIVELHPNDEPARNELVRLKKLTH